MCTPKCFRRIPQRLAAPATTCASTAAIRVHPGDSCRPKTPNIHGGDYGQKPEPVERCSCFLSHSAPALTALGPTPHRVRITEPGDELDDTAELTDAAGRAEPAPEDRRDRQHHVLGEGLPDHAEPEDPDEPRERRGQHTYEHRGVEQCCSRRDPPDEALVGNGISAEGQPPAQRAGQPTPGAVQLAQHPGGGHKHHDASTMTMTATIVSRPPGASMSSIIPTDPTTPAATNATTKPPNPNHHRDQRIRSSAQELRRPDRIREVSALRLRGLDPLPRHIRDPGRHVTPIQRSALPARADQTLVAFGDD